MAKKNELEECIAVIRDSFGKYQEAAEALARIKSKRLYKEFGSFEECIAHYFDGNSRSWAFDCLKWHEVNKSVAEEGVELNKAQTRLLAPLSTSQRKKVVKAAKRDGLTTATLRAATDEIMHKKKLLPPSAPRCQFECTKNGKMTTTDDPASWLAKVASSLKHPRKSVTISICPIAFTEEELAAQKPESL